MTLFYVSPIEDPGSHDLIDYLLACGDEVIGTYEGKTTSQAAAMIAEAEEIVFLPRFEDYDSGIRDRFLAAMQNKQMWRAHRDRFVWRLEYDEERTRMSTGNDFVTLDSGKRVEFASGMRRDDDEGKPRYDLIPLTPLRRLAELYARGAEKYGDRNWELAASPEEIARFKASAFRHLIQWLDGETDEDHAIAVAWNVFAVLELESRPRDYIDVTVIPDHVLKRVDL